MKLRTRIIISVIAANALINLFLCFYFTDQIKKFELTSLHERIQKAVYMMKLVNATPVYNVDKETIQMNMETFFDDENMKSISFQEYDIDIKFERTFENSKGVDIKKEFYIYHKGLKLGEMIVVYTTSLIEQKLEKLRNSILAVTFIGISFLSGILILLVNRLMQPVSDLTMAASEIASGNLDRKIDRNSVGDIGDLSRNFAVMRDAIKDKINDLAKINSSLENEIFLKEVNEKKIIKQSQVISSVSQFFQEAMPAQTYEEIAQIFIPILLKVIPSKYCFIGEIKGENNDQIDLIAISKETLKECEVSDMDLAVLSRGQDISGIRKRVLQENEVLIENYPQANSDFINFPENRLSINTFLGVPVKLGSEIKGLVVLAGKSEEYDNDDKKAAEMMATALMESFQLKKQEMEKKALEEMMIHSEKMVSIGGLAAGMAHEINNPLAGVLQNSQVVLSRLREKLPANMNAADELDLDFNKLQSYMDKRNIYKLMDLVLDAGKRAAEIVANMLSFSRKSTSGFMLEDIRELLDRTLSLAESDYSLKKKFDFKMVKIKKDYSKDIPKINCKASEIQQVFFNLLSNGAQAMFSMPKDHQACFVLKIFQEGDSVNIQIRDNGPGMLEETRKRVFEPFFTTKNVGEGTGLGLSVSYFIVTENHKGSIDVMSRPNEGTTFIIKLPIAP